MSKPPPGPRPTPLDELLAPSEARPTNGQIHESTSGQDDWPTFSARGVDPAVAERARVYKARHKGLTMGKIVTEALRLYLDQQETAD